MLVGTSELCPIFQLPISKLTIQISPRLETFQAETLQSFAERLTDSKWRLGCNDMQLGPNYCPKTQECRSDNVIADKVCAEA